MNKKQFLGELLKIKEDAGKMAKLRRVFNKDVSCIPGLAILASLEVPVANEKESLPYKLAAFLFATQKPASLSESNSSNFGGSLKKAFERINSEVPSDKRSDSMDKRFDKRFDSMVSTKSLKNLVENHLIRAIPMLGSNSVDYYKLIDDLEMWGTDVSKHWITGYYTPDKEEL